MFKYRCNILPIITISICVCLTALCVCYICSDDWIKYFYDILSCGIGIGYFFGVGMLYTDLRKHKKLLIITNIILFGAIIGIGFAKNRLTLPGALVISASFTIPYIIILIISKTKLKRKYKLSLLLAFVVILVMAITGNLGSRWQITLTSLAGIASIIYLNKENDEKKCGSALIIIGLFSLTCVLFGVYQLYLGDVIVFDLAIITTTAIISLRNNTKRIISLTISTIIILTIAYVFPYNLRVFLINYSSNNYKTQKEIAIEKIHLDYKIKTEDGILTPNKLKNKDVVIMFWSSHCGSCIKRYPDLSDLADNFANDTTKVVLAVYLPDNTGDTLYYNKTIQQHFSFKWGKAEDPVSICTQLNFNAVPHLTILNKDGFVVYNGIFEEDFALRSLK